MSHIVALLAICTDSTMAQTGVSGPVVVDGAKTVRHGTTETISTSTYW